MNVERYLEGPLRSDLEAKMVFLAGPRQVGKSTLARRILDQFGSGTYLGWDNFEDRKQIRAARWPGGKSLVVLDELHKWRTWKRWIKGEYDKHGSRTRFLVTGSARMDIYRRGGDSLQGRYHHYRLHPFTVAEVQRGAGGAMPELGSELDIPARAPTDTLRRLLEFGGFPEPFLAASTRTHRRWQKERLERFFREDVRDLEAVRDLSSIQILADLLPDRVGSPLSLNALREDLEVSHRAVTAWMGVLERLYHVVCLPPFASARVRGLRKRVKHYLWDWSLVRDPGARFENLVALHLLKFVHSLQDREGHDVELYYLRDRAGHEVDFLVTAGRKPWFAVEAKSSAERIDPSLPYFADRLRIPWAYQVVLDAQRDFIQNDVRCVPAHRFLAALV